MERKSLSEAVKEFEINEAKFEVSNSSYPSGGYKDEEVINWKANEIESLAKMLGLKRREKTQYGYGRFELNGTEVDVDADRNKPAIVVQVQGSYDKRVRVTKLSDKQIKNLKAKIEKLVSDKKERENKWDILKEMSSALYKKGVSVGNYDTEVNVDGISIHIGTGKASGTVRNDSYLSVSVNDGEKGIDKELAKIKKEMMAELKRYEKAMKIADKNIKEIKAYYDLKNKG